MSDGPPKAVDIKLPDLSAGVEAHPEVQEAVTAVSKSGVCNMYNVDEVVQQCLELGFDDAAVWISMNKPKYCRGVSRGFVTEEDSNGTDTGN